MPRLSEAILDYEERKGVEKTKDPKVESEERDKRTNRIRKVNLLRI